MEWDKVQGKAEVTGELGDTLDKTHEKAIGDAQQMGGAKVAFKEAALKISGLHAHIDKDAEEGKIPLSFETELEARTYLKKWVTRASEICLNLHKMTEARELVQNGKVVQLRQTLEVVQRYHTVAVSRAAQLEAAAAAPPEEKPPRRAAGEKPQSKLDERRAEASALKKKATKKKAAKKKVTKKKTIGKLRPIKAK